jgi:hypothetical protein
MARSGARTLGVASPSVEVRKRHRRTRDYDDGDEHGHHRAYIRGRLRCGESRGRAREGDSWVDGERRGGRMLAARLIPVSRENEADEGAGPAFLAVLTIVRDVPFQPPAIHEAPAHIAKSPR